MRSGNHVPCVSPSRDSSDDQPLSLLAEGVWCSHLRLPCPCLLACGDALRPTRLSNACAYLQDVEMPSPEAREAVERMCMLFHQSVRTLAANFQQELQRHYYATPTSFLELISTYKQLLGVKRGQVDTLKKR